MDRESARMVGLVASYVLGGLILGLLAARKNRDYWLWGLIGGLFCFPSLIALMFLPYLCPKCKRPLTYEEHNRGTCPTCSQPRKPKHCPNDEQLNAKGETPTEMKPPADFYKELPERTDDELYDMLTHPEDLLPEALEAAREEMGRRNLPPARTASPETDEELRALKIRVAEMASEKAEFEANLKAKEGSRPKEPAKAQGGWYAVLFLMSLLCFLGSYVVPSPEEAKPMRLMGGALFVAGMAAKAFSTPRKRQGP